ncbi:MAG: ribonuclease P protein component [Chitinophagales bacterium]|nr:ribonuclease P protein component [Chitinophagales bacterium]
MKDIDALFRHRYFLNSGLFRIYFLQQELSEGKEKVSFLVSVTKKKFPHAVDRNRIKRLIREAIRHEQSILHQIIDNSEFRYLFALTYMGNTLPDSATTTKYVKNLFQLWVKKHEKNTTDSHLSSGTID